MGGVKNFERVTDFYMFFPSPAKCCVVGNIISYYSRFKIKYEKNKAKPKRPLKCTCSLNHKRVNQYSLMQRKTVKN